LLALSVAAVAVAAAADSNVAAAAGTLIAQNARSTKHGKSWSRI